MRFLVAMLAVSVFAAHTGWAEEKDSCSRARELYRHGTKLMTYEDRAKAFAEATEICPDYAEAHVNLADCHENLGKLDSALHHYQRAIGLGLKSPIPYIGIGELYLKTGQFGLAKEIFTDGLVVAPGNARISAGLRVVKERIRREEVGFTADQIVSCASSDEAFRLMCMCPGDRYSHMKKWVCMPTIFFTTGSFNLTDRSKKKLKEVAQAINSEQLIAKRFRIIGHTDGLGSKTYNIRLSRKRAEKVKQFLVKQHGVKSTRLTVVFHGQSRPRENESSPTGQMLNRRVEIVVED